MWRYNMGWSIETGIWYSPYVVYDVDGNGYAEVYTKAGESGEDPREFDGHVLYGEEYLVKIDGRTGKIIKKIKWHSRDGFGYIIPPTSENFPNDTRYNYYSRNFLAVAYLDGKQPYLVMRRGDYANVKISAHNHKMDQIWYWEAAADNPGYRDQGHHGLIASDIDNDGCDELVFSAAAVDDNGVGLWNTGLGRPDVFYSADIDPHHPGLEVFYGVEAKRENNGVCLVSAKDGKILWGYEGPTKHVHSQGMIGDIDPYNDGMECYAGEADRSQFWLYSAGGIRISDRSFGTLDPKTVWWDEDSLKEVIINGKLFNYKEDTLMNIEEEVIAIADCLGDWREEIITGIEGELRIYSTTILSHTRRVCRMQDRQYRMGVAAGTMGYYYQPQLGGINML